MVLAYVDLKMFYILEREENHTQNLVKNLFHLCHNLCVYKQAYSKPNIKVTMRHIRCFSSAIYMNKLYYVHT